MILAIDASTPTTYIYLYGKTGNPAASLVWHSGRELSSDLLKQIKTFLRDQDITLQDVTAIILYSGPGSFTSLRIGHSVANALADSLKIKIVGATGEKWVETALAKLEHTKTGQLALPFYGAEANITKRSS